MSGTAAGPTAATDPGKMWPLLRLRLAAHIEAHQPVQVTTPCKAPGGKQVTARLVFTSRERAAMNRNHFNGYVSKPC
jgi:hypothetical protein